MVLNRTSRFRLTAKAILVALFSLVPPLLLFHIMPVGSSTEAREAHVASIIFKTGEWILPLRNGIIPSKPPLYHWLAAGLAHVSGEMSTFVCRIPSMLAGAGVIVLTFLLAAQLGRRRADDSCDPDSTTGLLAAGVLCTSWGFVPLLGEARVDMVFAFFATLAMYAVFQLLPGFPAGKCRTQPERENRAFLLFFSACGLATVARGPLGVILPGLQACAVLTVVLGWREAFRLLVRPRAGWLIFALMAFPWYVLAIQKGGQDFLGRQIFFENLLRFTGGEFVNRQPWWYYIPSFLRSAFPWSVLTLLFAVRAWKRDKAAPEVYERPSRVAQACENAPLVWFITGLLFFSLSVGKRHSYLLPLWPGLSVYVALRLRAWHENLSDPARVQVFHVANVLSLVLLWVLVVLSAFFTGLPRLPVSGNGLLAELQSWITPLSAYFLIVSSLAAGGFLVSRMAAPVLRAKLLLPSIFFALFSLLAMTFAGGLGAKNYLKGFERIASEIAFVSAGRELMVIKAARDESFDVVLYYINRPVSILSPERAFSGCNGLTLAGATWFADFSRLAADSGRSIRQLRRLKKTSGRYSARLDEEMVLFECG